MSIRAPRIVPPPRRASPSEGRQDSSTPTRRDSSRGPPPRTPPRRAPSRSIDRASSSALQESGSSFRDANIGEPVSRPADLPQQVGPRNDPPPVRRSNTPVTSARPISLPPPVRSHPPPSTIVSSIVTAPPLDSSLHHAPLRNEQQLFASRDGEQQVPPSAIIGTPQQQHQPQRRASAAPPSVAERQAVLRALNGSSSGAHGFAVASSSTTAPPMVPPNDPPFGPSRVVSLAQQSLQSQKPQPHSSAPTPFRDVGAVSLVEVSTFSPGGGSPLIVDLRRTQTKQSASHQPLNYSSASLSTMEEQHQYRRPNSLGDSPSSPPTGRRSVLAPVKTLVSTRTIADSDRSVVSSQSRASHLPDEQQTSANSFCYVQSTSALRHQPVRTPATKMDSEKPAPPPFIQTSISRPADAHASYAPQAARWDYLEQTPHPEPRRSGTGVSGGGGITTTNVEAAYVLCIVQVVSSEAHFANNELFDPVPEVRLRLCDLGSVSVKRLTDLVHVSLNYFPRHRGVLRCYAAENKPWIVNTSAAKGGNAKCITLTPLDAALSDFVNVGELMLPYDSTNNEALYCTCGGLRMGRWWWRSPLLLPRQLLQISPLSLYRKSVEWKCQTLNHSSGRGPSVSSTSTSVSLGGYRVERDPTPTTYVPDSRITPSHLLQQQQWHHNHVPFTLAAPNSAPQSQFHSRTQSENIRHDAQGCRSNSATSTPNMSPVRRTPGATTPATLSERQGPPQRATMDAVVASEPYQIQ
ncbi:Hypothetical protein, putative, partial [Bodo saltans]